MLRCWTKSISDRTKPLGRFSSFSKCSDQRLCCASTDEYGEPSVCLIRHDLVGINPRRAVCRSRMLFHTALHPNFLDSASDAVLRNQSSLALHTASLAAERARTNSRRTRGDDLLKISGIECYDVHTHTHTHTPELAASTVLSVAMTTSSNTSCLHMPRWH